MGQNQSVEEPYHKRHYNETNRQIQRQNSLSLSTTNLLLNRDLKRNGTVHNNSSANLTLAGIANAVASIPAGGPRSSSTIASTPVSAPIQSPLEGEGPKPFIRLLPIHTEPVYFDESDSDQDYEYEEGDAIEEEEDEVDSDTEALEKARRLQPSPSFLDGAMNVNSRLARSDSYEHHTRDRLDFERAQNEEQEDLSYLSPVSGARRAFKNTKGTHTGKAHGTLSGQEPGQNSDHPHYFDGENIAEAEPYDEIFVKRYQLHDPPVAKKPVKTEKAPGAVAGEQESTSTAQALPQSTSISSILAHSLGPIREEEDDIDNERAGQHEGTSKHKAVMSSDKEISRTGQMDSQPLQEGNVHTSVRDNVTQPKEQQERVTSPIYEDMVKSELDKRIQDAVLQVERKLSERVQRLEIQTGAVPAAQGNESQRSHHLQGSLALRKEMLSNVSQRVGDLDSRVDQMESMVSYKLVDIESKVQELDGEQQAIATEMDQVELLNQGKELQRYQPAVENALFNQSYPPVVVDNASITELRQELQAFGMRYHELNDGLLTDLMVQLREAKLMLFETVDETDQRLGKRVDRIEAEMHAKLLYDIELRIQERVRAMEQTSSRLATCFDKMEGRLGALETVLASKRPRPESIYYQRPLSTSSSEEETQNRRPYQRNLDSSPETPLPWPSSNPSGTVHNHNFGVSTAASSSSSSLSALQGTSRIAVRRPSRITTDSTVNGTRPHGSTNWTSGPHSAGPGNTRNLERAMTFDNMQSSSSMSSYSQSLPGGQQNNYIHSASPQKSSASQTTLIGFKGALKSTGTPIPSPTSAGPKPAKNIRRPSSYKELLHFWKAGGSTPDLLQTLPSSSQNP
ncbi:hypothetical protein EMPS_11160 [Entomortierella parvispora]|uniref:Uncharacterized protein n=1 Tax=Entomortierella parvispora TaxID=205924 RepID=A0A9P3HLI8_9FUNG|nr:hypothetical protein EMPS_11160 [Entomortierella parvispora]